MGAWPHHWVQRIGVTGGFEAHINFLEAVAMSLVSCLQVSGDNDEV